MINFAFVYLYGKNVIMGELLAQSIKRLYPYNKLIQITDDYSEQINSIDNVERFKFTRSHFMKDCIESQLKIFNKYGPTIFLDADLIVLKKIDDFFEFKDFDFSLTESSNLSKSIILNNEKHKKNFPDLINKTLGETMPYNAGIYCCNKKEPLEFMLNIFKTMNKNYLEWYGDQLALKKLVESKLYKIKVFQESIYNYTPIKSDEDLSNKKILHFKGDSKKLFIPICEKFFGTSHIEKVAKKLENTPIKTN